LICIMLEQHWLEKTNQCCFFVTKGGESLRRKQAKNFRFRQVLFSRSMMLLSAAIRLDGVETLYTINMLDLMN